MSVASPQGCKLKGSRPATLTINGTAFATSSQFPSRQTATLAFRQRQTRRMSRIEPVPRSDMVNGLLSDTLGSPCLKPPLARLIPARTAGSVDKVVSLI